MERTGAPLPTAGSGVPGVRPEGTKTFAEPVQTLVMTMRRIQNTNVPLMKQQLCLGLKSVTTCTGDIL